MKGKDTTMKEKMKKVSTVMGVIFVSGLLLLSLNMSATAGSDMKDVKEELSEAATAIKEYSVDQKDDAVDEIEDAMDAVDKKIEELEDKADEKWEKMSEQSRKNWKKTRKKLEQQRQKLSEWYGGVKYSTSESWEEVKGGFIKGYESLSDELADAYEDLTGSKEGK